MVTDGGRTDASAAATAVSAGVPAPAFSLRDTPHTRVTLEDFRGRQVVLAFYVADWDPVASAQLGVYQQLLGHLEHLDASVLGISVDGTWSHQEFARAYGITFPLLSDDEPPGDVARAYGVYVAETGRSQRALFVIDRDGIVRWRSIFPDAVNPGADGVLSALEHLRLPPVNSPETYGRNGVDSAACPCGCGLSMAQVGGRDVDGGVAV